MLLAILGAGVSEGLDPRNIDDYVTFLVPGMIVMTAVFSSTFSSASYYQDRDSGMLRVMLASPHPPRVIFLAKMAGAMIVGVAQALIVLGVAAAVPAIDFSWRYGVGGSLALTAGGIVLVNVFLAGVAQVLATRISTMQGFHLLMNLVLFPFLFFSGAFFPLEDLPAWLKVLGAVNPLAYVVDLMQTALYAEDGDGFFGVPVALGVSVALAAAALYLGTSRATGAER
jgi:ABC-2 type transport system permease protein